MFDKIKSLGTDTAVYGVSTILGRFLTFFLTPFYTHLLLPADLGVVATQYAYIAFLNVVYGYGMESAYMKYVSTLEVGTRKQNFTVPFVSVAVSSLALTLLAFLFRGSIADLAGLPYPAVVGYGALILLFDAVAIIPFAELRMARKSRVFAAIKLAGIVINVACNLVLLLHFQAGVEGVFLSGAIASASVVLMLVPSIRRNLGGAWSGVLFSALLRFGLPYVPAGLAAMMIQVINRPILEALRGTAAVGVFQANYRLGIFMMLLVSMFDFAWRPFFLSHASDPGAKPLFAQVMTYAVLVFTVVFLSLSLFLGDIVRAPVFAGRALIAPPYWVGLDIVPLILLGYLFLGVYNILVAGIYIEKKTSYLPAVTMCGAMVSVAANYLFIPAYGLTGAAFATCLSYVVLAVVMYVVVQRVYPVPYEWGRLLKIAISAAASIAPSYLFPNAFAGLASRAGLLAGFLLLMYMMRFFTPAELVGIRGLLKPGRGGPTEPGTSGDL